MTKVRDRGMPNCGRCGAVKQRRVRDGYLECRECKKAYLRLVQSSGLTRKQARVANRVLEGLGRFDPPPPYDPDATSGVDDSKWVGRCVKELTRWLVCVRANPTKRPHRVNRAGWGLRY
jgi:hypothetical protein